MTDGAEEETEKSTQAVKTEQLLSFKTSGRNIAPNALSAEFSLMKGCLKSPLTPKVALRLADKSGNYLLKLVSPRTDGDNAILRIEVPRGNKLGDILPSTNAPDIPFCKVIFRPLEIDGYPPRSVVDLIRNPEDHTTIVLDAFAEVFGTDVLETLKTSLLTVLPAPTQLGIGEFPIIFVPRPDGQDLQITPVSPAAAFMGMKRVRKHYFQKTQPDRPMPRSKWTEQAVSAKPQNISGAIGGPRVRFRADMPTQLSHEEADLFRFAQGGSFPLWRDSAVAARILRYGDRLTSDNEFNNKNTRAALNQVADDLISDAVEFIQDTLRDTVDYAKRQGIAEKHSALPSLPQLLLKRRWKNTDEEDKARKALTSPHFELRLAKSRMAAKGL
ncbi:hypothetical protein AA106555_1820 [Neokomagataea thailandica NBRC 106555]|uniref:Uncharacterized protein n=2 Tax=Neokomagataea TaxID=1223423 RepID=A0A4Y6VC29_9PROT|nr:MULTISPECIES: hypothetical protein [Neokomagataea]QDH26081.1 hypothetical protein D5366_11770 [Neokomagataea tanensis]GBR54776.1 hypothetical protein AA106555_1820 [Neokomagataea thailandica NBRC 106555]